MIEDDIIAIRWAAVDGKNRLIFSTTFGSHFKKTLKPRCTIDTMPFGIYKGENIKGLPLSYRLYIAQTIKDGELLESIIATILI
mgnify:CR=1 FL=1